MSRFPPCVAWCLLLVAGFLRLADAETVWETGRFADEASHGLDIEREGAGGVSVVNGCLRVSGENQYARTTLSRSFTGAPYPDEITFTFAPVDAEIGGRLVFRIHNVDTGASLSVMRSSANEYAWTYGEDARWTDWKRYMPVYPAVGLDGAVTVRIEKVSADAFQVFVNDQPISDEIKNPALKAITRLTVVAEFKTLFDLVSIRASARSGGQGAAVANDVRPTRVSLLAPGAEPTPTNPNANGYQIAYFERGYSDGMTDPARRAEFVSVLRTLNPSALRFPGGTWAYWYSDVSPKSVAAFARLKDAPYWTKQFSEFRWSNDDYFLGICKELGVAAIYQLNVGTWYDVKTDRAYRLAPFDRRLKEGLAAEQVMQSDQDVGAVDIAPEMQDVNTSFMKDATAHAARLARKAKALGLKVVWEFGNEDYVNFQPETYVRQCRAFYDAIRAVVPDAQFAFCADSDSWSNHAWSTAVYAQLVKHGMTDMAEASVHMYLTGGGGGPRGTGKELYKATRNAWNTLRHMHDGWRKRLAKAGLGGARLSLTEYNAVHIVKNLTGGPLEHSMGRALGEASVWPDIVGRFNYIVFHDLIRNGYGHGTWFSRMHYMPQNPEGSRYMLALDGKVMSVMHRHAAGKIVHADEFVVVSQARGSLLISIGNPNPAGVTHEIRLKGVEAYRDWPRQPRAVRWQSLVAPDIGTPEHIAVEITGQMKGDVLTVSVPGYSFTHVAFPLR